MKKPMSLALALLLAFALAACSSAPAAPSADSSADAPADTIPTPAPLYSVEGEWANSVVVHTVDELLSAIASDTAIYLAPGDYNLASASDYGAQSDAAAPYSWVEVYSDVEGGEAPAYELCISGVSNLALIADNTTDARPTITAVPRYANVLRFTACDDIALWGVTAGHTEAPGECSGGVIMLEYVNGAKINECRLYGCGTVGIQSYESRAISAEGTHIFDCSYSAVSAYSTTDFVLDHCQVYDCGINGYDGLFSLSSTTGFSVLNSDISDCTGATLITSGYSRNVYMLGCTVSGSTAFDQALFSVNGENITVDNTSFGSGLYYPSLYTDYSDASARTIVGEELTASLISHMERVETQHPALSSAPEVSLDVTVEEGIRYVHVGTVDELLSAIAPDTVIYLDSALYDLSTATAYGGSGGEWYGWVSEYDGPGLEIIGVDNLSIVSETGAQIVATPRYVDVLRFSRCCDVTLSGVILGHTEQPDACTGNVVGLYGCTGVALADCRLYGCGVVGVYAVESSQINVTNTEIYDCSSSAVHLYAVSDAAFTNCDIHDCGSPEINIFDSTNVTYNGQALNTGSYSSYNVTEQGIDEYIDEEMKDLWYSSGGLCIYYDGYELRDCTLHVGDEVTLTALYADGTPAANPVWTWTWGRYENGDFVTEVLKEDAPANGGGFTLTADKPCPGGTRLTVSDGTTPTAPYCNLRVYVIE